jgi:hypothetical protein
MKLELNNKEFYTIFNALRLDMSRKQRDSEPITKEFKDLYHKLNMMLPLQDENK